MKFSALSKITTLALAVALAACNENDHDQPAVVAPASLTVSVSLGKVTKGGTIELKNAETDAQIGKLAIVNGSATFSVPKTIKAVEAVVTLAAGDKYFDEALNAEVVVPAGGVVLRAVSLFNGTLSQMAVTPLSEAAVSYAKTRVNGTKSTTNITQANQKVADYFAVNDVLTAPVLLGSMTDYQTMLKPNDEASKRALLILALVRNAQAKLQPLCAGQADQAVCLAAPALQLSNALSSDFADGQVDHKKQTESFTARQKLYSTDRTALQNELNAILSNLANEFVLDGITLPQSVLTAINGSQVQFVTNDGSNITQPNALCGLEKTLTTTDLAQFAKTYDVTIRKDVGAELPFNVKNTQFVLQATGSTQLDGVTAQVSAVCEHRNSQQQADGLVTYLNKKTTLEQAATITFFNDGRVQGDDYTTTQGIQTFDNSTGITPNTSSLVDVEVTGAAAERLTSDNLESFLNSDGLLVLDVNGRVLIRFNNGIISQVQFVKDGKIWRMSCEGTSCANISLNTQTNVVTLNNLVITADESTGATATVSLSGSIAYANPSGSASLSGLSTIQTVSVDVKQGIGVNMELAFRTNPAAGQMREQIKVSYNNDTGALLQLLYIKQNDDDTQHLEYGCDGIACMNVQFNSQTRSLALNGTSLPLLSNVGVTNAPVSLTFTGAFGKN